MLKLKANSHRGTHAYFGLFFLPTVPELKMSFLSILGKRVHAEQLWPPAGALSLPAAIPRYLWSFCGAGLLHWHRGRGISRSLPSLPKTIWLLGWILLGFGWGFLF